MALVVNGETIGDEVIREEVKLTRPRYEQMVDGLDSVAREIQLWEWSKETVIERTLLRQEALKHIEPVPAEIVEQAMKSIPDAAEDRRAEIENRIRVDLFLRKVTAGVPAPTHKEASDYYKKYKEQFHFPEMVRASHILKKVDDNTDGEAALSVLRKVEAELRLGAAFEDLVGKYSDDLANGGDLGYFPRGAMVPEFEQVAFALAVGETSPIFRTPFGFHIARCYAKKPAGLRGFADVRVDIERMLHQEKRERFLEQYVDSLKAKADIRSLSRKS